MPAALEMTQRHLECLYGISKLLASYEGAQTTFPLLFAAATKTLPLDILVMLENAGKPALSYVEKRASVGAKRVSAALANARHALASYTEENAVSGDVDIKPTGGPLVLPLAVGGRSLGLLYVEAEGALDELAVAFLSALSNQLAVAIDRHHALCTAQNAIQSRDNVLAIVSHDLRNMLSSILLTTQIATEGAPTIERRTFGNKSFGLIQRSAERMNHLIDDLLDMASIDAGHITVDCTSQAVRPLFSEVAEIFRQQADNKQVEFKDELSPDLSNVFVDRDRVLQVLSNLVSNAIKFTPPKGTILLRAEPLLNMVLFSMKDTGPGISPEQQPHIFDRFWQARRTAKLGTGLGLSIAKSIVEALGGQIWVESQPGSGTTFFFTLPTAETDADPSSSPLR